MQPIKCKEITSLTFINARAASSNYFRLRSGLSAESCEMDQLGLFFTCPSRKEPIEIFEKERPMKAKRGKKLLSKPSVHLIQKGSVRFFSPVVPASNRSSVPIGVGQPQRGV